MFGMSWFVVVVVVVVVVVAVVVLLEVCLILILMFSVFLWVFLCLIFRLVFMFWHLLSGFDGFALRKCKFVLFADGLFLREVTVPYCFLGNCRFSGSPLLLNGKGSDVRMVYITYVAKVRT